ncbi:MAG: 3-methyl-2-oxobutanoate hydroxymethyltransferase [Vampirovibrionales bacterium]|nr:3-methyl-2-oxobutanoate hydroxymethyltransferase [Vampirovibrionales bacterium]
MTDASSPKPLTCRSLSRKKERGEKIVALTAYDYATARLLDATGSVDLLLVGDSLAMTVLGHRDTLSVTMDEMAHHVKAVTRGAQRAVVVADMPFLSYGVDLAEGVRHAGRFIQECRAQAVKVEGASSPVVALIERLVSLGVPVVGHLGFTPQFIHALGGPRAQGRSVEAASRLREDAMRLQAAGAFALVLEMTPPPVARWIAARLTIPVIGIGSGAGCDGQILVIDDLLGRFPDFHPRFARQYAPLGEMTQDAARRFAADVAGGDFPDEQVEAYPLTSQEAADLAALLAAE